MASEPANKEREREREREGANAAGSSLRALPQRVMPKVDELLGRRWAQMVFLGLLATCLTLVLSPSYSAKNYSIAQNLKVGERASANIKATRDFDYYLGKGELQRKREQAEKNVLPVFGHHQDTGPILLSRITRAFQAMSAVYRPTPGGSAGKARRGGQRKGQTPASAPARSPKVNPPDDAVLRLQLANSLQTEVSLEVFSQLRSAKFSGDVQHSVLVLVGSAMEHLVISHRGALAPFRGKPITIRALVGGRPTSKPEKTLASLDSIKDLRDIRAQLQQKVAVHGSKLTPAARNAVVELVESLIVPNLVYDPGETQRRKDTATAGIRTRPLTFVRGQVIIRDGDPITERHVRIVKTMEQTLKGVNIVQVLIGMALFVLVVVVTMYRYASQQFQRFHPAARDLLMMGAVLVGMLALTRGVISMAGAQHLGIARYMLPVAGGAMLVRLVATAEAAALFGVVASALCGLLVESSLGLTLFYMVTSLVGAYGVARVQSRGTLLRAGLMAGLLGGAAVLCLQLFGGQLVLRELVLGVLAAVAGGLLSAFVALALLPVLEWFFAYTTDISLLELANLNHPLLRDLMLRAPGTYHHSMVVGNLAEAACEGIDANGLLARVASYYHDVGKMKNAAYFAENFRSDENPHTRLKPSMSALIIRSHVKDGIEMMQEHGIPLPVIECASQHHGTALISFFYHKALEQKDAEDEVVEAEYRYPGLKPQTREAGVIMVADGVEAACRSLQEPTADRLRAVVQRIINTQFTDGQLDHCDLTLRDLHLIAKSFLQVLGGIYHARPSYPWQKGKEEPRKKNPRKEGADATAPGQKVEGVGQSQSSRKEPGDGSKKRAEKEPEHPEPEGEGEGADLAESDDADAAATESSPDIKRLGLN